MKKLLFLVAIIATAFVSSCDKFDDSEIWNKLENHENRISALEELCKQLNTNINALQTIVNALEKNDYITNVSPIRKDGDIIGYTITFAHSDTITIYNGADGKDGADGYTPQIGVMKDTDGIYYWTVDGEWLLDARGNKIKAVGQDGKDGQDGVDGEDGKDGQNGTNGTDGEDGKDGQDGVDGKDGQDGADGVTPRLKIENDYWYVSYDNGATWIELGKATGEDGTDGSDGNSITITQDEENVYFELADGEIITIAKKYSVKGADFIDFDDVAVKTICIQNWDTNYDGELSYDEAAAVTDLGTVFEGTSISFFNELQYFIGLECIGDNSFYKCTSLVAIVLPAQIKSINQQAFYGCSALRNIKIPQSVTSIGDYVFKECSSLKNIEFEQKSQLSVIGLGAFYGCVAIVDIEIPKSVEVIETSAFQGCSNLKTIRFELNSILKNIGGNKTSGAFTGCKALTDIKIPSSVEVIGASAFRGCSSLSTITFGENSKLKSIEGYYTKYSDGGFDDPYGAFSDCDSLTSISIPESVEIIGDAAFYRSPLSIIIISDNSILNKIGEYAFRYTEIKEFTVPYKVEEIGKDAFPSSVEKLYCKPINPPIVDTKNGMLGYTPDRIYVPRVSVDSYKSTKGWAFYSNYIFGYDFE